jgi:hypothetical protein
MVQKRLKMNTTTQKTTPEFTSSKLDRIAPLNSAIVKVWLEPGTVVGGKSWHED